MSKGLSLRCILAASFVVVSLVISYASLGGAELTLSRRVWDFESIEEGETKAQKIILTNAGEQPLKIDKIELPEGCSVKPDLADKEIQATEELEVEFTFDSQGKLGKLQQYAYIFLSDSTVVPLTIKGEVFAKAQPRLQLTPTVWDFGTVKVGESSQRTFRCKNAGTGDLKIEKVQIYDSKFRVIRNITKETLAPGAEVDFAVSVNPKYAGKYDTDFYVKSNSVGRKYTKVSIKGYAVSKTVGVVVSHDLSSLTNNTPYQVEVTRTDNLGKEETLTVERDSRKSFPREPGPLRTNPQDYTLTIKLVKPSPPTPPPKPAETKAPGEKPSPATPKPETKPAEEKPDDEMAPAPETQPSKAEETVPPGKAEEKEEKKPGEPKEEKEAAPSEKEEPDKPSQESPAKPEEEKPSEEKAPPKKEAPSVKPEKTEPSEGPGKKEETPSKEQKAEKGPAPTPEKQDTEKPPKDSEKDQSSEKPASPPSAGPAGSSGSPGPPKKSSDEGASANR